MITDDYARADLEATIAARLLAGAGPDAPLTELESYAHAVALAVYAARGPLSPDTAEQLASSLASARERLLDEAGSFAL